LFTKQAVGDKKPDMVEVFDSLVQYIKDAIDLYGDKIKSSRELADIMGVKHNKMFREAYGAASGENKYSGGSKMRGFPKRIKEFEEFKDIKLDIEQNPNLKYNPQNLRESSDVLSNMSEEELIKTSNDPTDNTSTLAYIERINRMRSHGENIMPLLEEVSAKGTTYGQLVRQFAEMKGTVPENVTASVESMVEKAGRYLTDEQKTDLTQLAKEDIESRHAWREQQQRVKELMTEGEIEKEKQLREESEKAYIKLAQRIHDLVPVKFWDMMGMAMQGNLLTPMSQITNIYANLMNIPLAEGATMFGSIPDAMAHYLGKQPKMITLNPRVQLEGIKGFARGIKESLGQFKTGINVNAKTDFQRGLHQLGPLYRHFPPNLKLTCRLM
jgi:hypothetical protein